MNASVSVLCYKYKTLSNGEHPLMLRIYKDNKRKLVSLGISVQYNNWDFTKNEPKPKCPNKDLINKIILDKKVEYQKQILELNAEEKDYTATTLVETTNIKYVRKTVWEYYNDLIKEFRESGKEGNRLVYKYSRNSLNTFMKGKLNTILFSDIDINWLNRYEKELRTKKCEETSMSVLFRTLRSTRHTFATVLRRSNVDIGIISEALGHTELSTTQIYLDSFENEQVDAAMSNLL